MDGNGDKLPPPADDSMYSEGDYGDERRKGERTPSTIGPLVDPLQPVGTSILSSEGNNRAVIHPLVTASSFILTTLHLVYHFST